MALRKAGLPIQFQGGMNNKQDHKQVPATQLLDLQNAVFTRETTLSKRNGYAAKSQAIDGAGALYTGARGLAARGDELLLFTDERCYSHRPAADRWSDAGEVASTVCSDVPIARTGTQQWIADTATVSNVCAVAWEDSRGGIWASVVEDSTGRILLAQQQLDASGSKPRCIAVGDVIAILWLRASAGEIRIALVNPALPETVPTPTTLTNDVAPSLPFYDACPTPSTLADLTGPGATGGLVAWTRNGGGYRVGYLDQSGVLGSPVTGWPSVATYTDTVAGPIAVSVSADAADTPVAVLWQSAASPNATISVRFVDPTDLTSEYRTAAVVGPETGVDFNALTCDFGALDGTYQVFVWAAEETATRTDLCQVHTGKALVDGTTYDLNYTTIRGHVLLSRAFHDGAITAPDARVEGSEPDGSVYVTIGHAARFFPYAAVIRLSDAGTATGQSSALPVARLLPGVASGYLYRYATSGGAFSLAKHLPSVEARNVAAGDQYSRQHRIPIGVRLQLDSEDGDQFGELGIRLVTIDFDAATAHQTAELGRGLYLSSACPQHYDGDRWVEADYHTAPDRGFTIASGAAAPLSGAFTTQNVGGGMAAGTYLYKLWYEDVDGQGELHPGPTSVGVLVTLAAGEDQVTITVPTYRLTRKRRVRLCVARSVEGATGTDESIELFRCSGLDPNADPTDPNAFQVNDTTADTVTFIDSLSDADLAVREPLYTNGGVLSNAPAPWAGGCIAGGKSRLFWTDPSDPNLIRFSQQLRDETALEAPIDLAIRVDPYGGPIVAIGEMDGAIYAFKETAVFVFGGDGPLANPAAASEAFTFTPPQLVTGDVGCASPTTIVQSPVGIMFDTVKGIRLLSRQRQVVPIGDPVEGFNGQTFRRSTLIPDRPHILFLTDSGSTLLFDYERGQWSRFTNHEGLDAVVVDGVYHYLRTDGRVFAETAGLYVDDNSHIAMKIETAWIKMIGYLQGWQRIHYANFLGEYKSAHTLRVRWRIDYQAGYSAPYDLDVDTNFDPTLYGDGLYGAGLYGGAENYGTVYQRRVHINRRCQAISFLIEDVEATDDFGASFELSELLLTGGVLGPEFKMGAARSS